jgi:MFS family permease
MFIIWIIPCALAPNMATLLVARFLDGLSGSAFLSIAGGSVGDLFSKEELSTPMMVYTASPFVGYVCIFLNPLAPDQYALGSAVTHNCVVCKLVTLLVETFQIQESDYTSESVALTRNHIARLEINTFK